MNPARVATAPGKVVLSGEYAVLDGAPAVCMAVNRRARVTMRPADGAEGSVSAPGFSAAVGRYRLVNGEPSWLSGTQSFAIVDAAWRACSAAPSAAVDLVLDTAQFVDRASGNKLGVGSSAAITVALCAALNGKDGSPATAYDAHRFLHGASGSGVDVACSLHGGLIEYFRDGMQTTTLQWPSGLAFRLVWSGVTVSTSDKLAMFDKSKVMPSRTRLKQSAEALAAHWRSGDAEAVVSNYRDYVSHLLHFSDEHDLGIFAAGHRELLDTANSAGLVYKPCGAGGGDIGIVLGTDAGRLDEFIRELSGQFTPVDCVLDRDGLKLEEHT